MRLITRHRLLYPSKVEYASWGINHYEGCAHGCLYCSQMRRCLRFKHFKDRRDWMHPKVVKNAPEQVFAEIHSDGLTGLDKRQIWVWLCPATDPYQPIEEELQYTSRILKHLVQARIPVRILTKSEGVYADEDTIFQHRDLVQVGFTVTTIDGELARKWEPNASLVHDRVKALRYFHANGVRTWVSAEPLLDAHPEDLLNELTDSVDYWYFGKDNYLRHDLPYADICNRIVSWFQQRGMTNYLIKKELWKTKEVALDGSD